MATYSYIPKPARCMLTKDPINLGLVGAWPLHEGAGEKVRDLCPMHNHGDFATSNGGKPEWAGSALRTVVEFPDKGNIYIPYQAAYSGGVVSVDTMFRLTLWPSAQGREFRIVINRHAIDPWLSWYIYVKTNDHVAYGLVSSTPTPVYVEGPAISVGTWYHAGLTVDADGNYVCYLNGKAVAASVLDAGLFASTSSVCISDSGTKWMSGLVSHLRIWNRVLSKREMATLNRDPWIGLRRERALVEV